MRAYRLIYGLMVLALVGCKATQTTTSVPSGTYQEDLKVWRPEMPNVDTQEPNSEVVNQLMPLQFPGSIKAELDSINAMMAKANTRPRNVNGYTIQIYSGTSREEGNKHLMSFRVKFPDIEVEMIYFQPDFKVKAGKYQDKLQAYEAHERVKVEFPQSLLIPEQITLKYE
jgi:hypothetical protein